MKSKKTIVIIGVVSIVFLACLLSVAKGSTIAPMATNDANLDSINASDGTNLDFINEIFDSKSADFSSNGYYPQIYSDSLQATYYALSILDSIGKIDEIDQEQVITYIMSHYNYSTDQFIDDSAKRYLSSMIPVLYLPLSTLLEVNCYAVLSLDFLNSLHLIDSAEILDFIWECYHPNLHGFIGQPYDASLDEGFKIPTADNTYYAVTTLDLFIPDWGSYSQERGDIVNYLDGLQSVGPNAGFYNDDEPLFDSLYEIEPNQFSSFYAIKTLETFGSAYINVLDIAKFHQDLTELYYPEDYYFDVSSVLWVPNYTNIVATAINLELSDLTGFTEFNRAGVIYAPFSIIRNEKGESMKILPKTLYTEVQKFLDYKYDQDGWTDPSQQIELVYATEYKWRYWSSQEGIDIDTYTFEHDHISEVYSGYWYIVENYGHLLKGLVPMTQIFDTVEKIEILDDFYQRFIEPYQMDIVNSFKKGGEFDIDKFGNGFKSYFDRLTTGKYMTDYLKSLGADKGQIKVWESIMGELFDKKFKAGLTTATKKWLDSGKTNSDFFERIVSIKAGEMVFDYIMRKHLEIHKGTFNPDILPEMINNLLISPSEVILGVEGILKREDVMSNLLNSYVADTFFGIVFTDKMYLDNFRRPDNFIGEIGEKLVFFKDLSLRLAEAYYEGGAIEGFFDALHHNPQASLQGFNKEYLKSSDNFKRIVSVLDDSIDTSSLDISRTSRNYDLIVAVLETLIISFHIKHASELLNSRKLANTINEIAIDDLSTIEVDLILHLNELLTNGKTNIRKHISWDYSPMTSIGSLYERKEVSLAILREIFSTSTYEDVIHQRTGSLKVYRDRLYRYKVTALLNKYMKVDTSLDTSDKVKEKVEFLFNDKDFKKDLKSIIKSLYGDKKKLNAFIRDTTSLFTSDVNLNKLIQFKVQDNTFELVWEANIAFLLDSGLDLTFDMLPTDTFVPIGDNNKKTLTREMFNKFMQDKSKLLAIHDKEGRVGVIPAEMVNNLPKGFREGYYDPNSKEIYHNVYLNNEEGFCLYGRVKLEGGRFSVRPSNWYTSKDFLRSYIENRKLPSRLSKDGGKVDIFTLNYYRVITYATGSSFVSLFQEADSNIAPYPLYQEYLPSRVSGHKSMMKTLRDAKTTAFYTPPDNIAEVYGTEFTIATFYKIFAQLFDPKAKITQSTRAPQPLAMKYLDMLNGYFTTNDFKGFEPGPSIERVNYLINELGLSEDNLLKLLWKTNAGEFRKSQSQKEWLNLIYQIITNYDSKKISADPEVAKLTDALKSLPSRTNYDLLNTGTDKYTPNEIRMAKSIFEAAQVLFGHFTLRLAGANMLDYYGSVSNYKIKIMNRPKVTVNVKRDGKAITDFLRHVGIVAVSSRSEAPLQSLKMRAYMPQYSPTHFFGLFFLDSFITLKTDSKNVNNQLRFNTGPLIAIDKSGGFSAKSPRKLSMRMAEHFGNSYLAYYANHLDISNDQLLMKQFVDSQTELFMYIKSEIIKKVVTGNLLGSQNKNYWFATRLIQRARYELYSPSFDSTDNLLRRQLEKQLIKKAEIIQLSFHKVKIPGTTIDFRLTIKQSDVLNIDFRSWGLNKKLKGLYTKLKTTHMKPYIQDTTDYLRTFIKALTGGKARIFILTDTGDADLGYQYLVPQLNKDGDIYKEALKSREWIPKGPSYFDIDLTSDTSQDRKILEHLVNVMLGTTDLIVIKEEGGAIDDGKMICAFNQYKFFRPNEILSGPSGGKVYDAYKYNNYQMIITAQSIKFYKRGSAWFNYMGWSSGGGSEFRNYLNSIFNDPSNYLNQFLIKYTRP